MATSAWLINEAGAIALQSDPDTPYRWSDPRLMTYRFLLLAAVLATHPATADDLLAIYDLALQHDPVSRQAAANRDSALQTRPQGIARLLPQVAVTGRMNRDWVYSRLSNVQLCGRQSCDDRTLSLTGQAAIAGARRAEFWDSSASMTLQQPVYHHEYWVQLSQSDNQIARAQANYEASVQDLAVRTATAYFNLLYAEDSLDFSNAQLKGVERQLEQAKARFDVGLIAITDVNEAQAGYDQARASVLKSENDVDNAREALREIIGSYVGDIDPLNQEFALKPPQPGNIEDWSDRAAEQNLSIIAALNQQEVAKKNIELQFAGHLPTVDIVGAIGFSDNNRPNGVSAESGVIGMQVNVPLLQGGGVNARVTQARHDLEAAQEALEGQRRLVQKQIKVAYRGIHSNISQAEAYKAAVTSSESALEATEAGFEVGTRTMVEVLTTQTNLYNAKRNYAKARYDYITSSLTLKQVASTLQREDLELVNGWLTRSAAAKSRPAEPKEN